MGTHVRYNGNIGMNVRIELQGGNFMNLYEFESLEEVFKTEEDCESFLMKRRWGDGFCCPRCDNHLFYRVKTRKLLECKECRTQISLTAGTVMHKSKLPLMLWFKAIQALIREGQAYSIAQFAELLGVNYRTAKLMLEKIQLALSKVHRNKSQEKEADNSKSPILITNFGSFMFKNSKNIKYDEMILFKKWMNAFVSVRLFPLFLRCYQML
ncbi:IS1595 family transposase [Bacillus sp. 3255]|uniref:IS1595 family transposase n=1 Tax=Bacillus sp. 3255 TaxID=2817904 RepID=UPI00286B0996|nr:IS1595 family transposase [Bacillus sp. 3255]